MGKGFFNFSKKTSRQIFEPRIMNTSHQRNIGSHKKSMIRETMNELHLGHKQGNKLVAAGQLGQVGGMLSGNPELAVAGIGLEFVGEVARGGSTKEVLSRFGKDITAGYGDFAQNTAGKIGKTIGTVIDTQIDNQTKPDKHREETDPTHHNTLTDQTEENEHTHEQEQHHNSVLLPDNLQANSQSNVGEKLQITPDSVAKTVGEFEKDVGNFNDEIQIIEFLVNNLNNLEHLPQEEREEVFREAVMTGVLDEFLNRIESSFV